MKAKLLIVFLLGSLCCLPMATIAEADEEALFMTSTAPDALIVLDLSGSMQWNPPGDDLTYGSTESCYADTANCTGTGCSGGFCRNSKSPTTYYAKETCGAASAACNGTNCENGFCSASKGTTTYYAASDCGTPDPVNCAGSGCINGFCAGSTYYAHDSTCTASTYHCNRDRWYDCRNGFCSSPHSSYTRSCEYQCSTAPSTCSTACTGSCTVQCTSGGCTKACSRLNIAKRSIRNILDDNNDGTINSTDETSLGIRLGYMRFYNCQDDDTGGSYSSGCNSLRNAINTSYSTINTTVQAEGAVGGTPIRSALKEAKLYLDAHKASDAAKNCRSKFVILITDGADTYACSGDGTECDPHRYKNRRVDVAMVKELADAGYKVFVIGFGTAMPPYLKNTLNWMAFYGGTDDPSTANTGNTSAYGIVTGCSSTNTAACCSSSNEGACYPTGVTSCAADSTAADGRCYDADHPYQGDPNSGGVVTGSFKAGTNDPGYLDLSGYAFIAGSADELVAAVKAAINIIREATYSFSQSSIQSNRTVDENFIYEASFQPVSGDPLWLGHLKKLSVNTDGTVGSALWDAGEKLRDTDAASRVIKTHKNGSLTDFNTTNITSTDLAVANDAARDAVVGYIRGETAYNPDNWKLGDVFRSSPITVGTPSQYYSDIRDTGNPTAFSTHRDSHPRTSANGYRIIIAGANDGQLHAFKTSDGTESWSFIPPNQLSRLKLIVHTTHPTSLTHAYFIDGPVTVADVWLGSGDGTSKSASDWYTLLVVGEGRGATTTTYPNLWSKYGDCDSDFSGMYSADYPHYCGYYALNLTTSTAPAFKWRLGLSSSQAPYMGSPWSRMAVGRVKVGGNEKWVGFIGGGAYAPNATHSGKGLFVVDLADGSVLWSYTRADNSSLDYPMPAPPAIVDTDSDGFIDTAYIGDIGGHMWRFKFCRIEDGDSCGTSDWAGGRLFQASSRPIYTKPVVTRDRDGYFWVYWGTGDKTDPTASVYSEKIFAMKDTDRSSTRTISDLQDITSGTYTDTDKYGFYISTSLGEKVLSDMEMFGGILYATTFTPTSSSDPCEQSGTAKLYGLYAFTGAGGLATGATTPPRSMVIGTGISSAPVISMRPGSAGSGTADLYVTTSGGGIIGASTQRVNINPPGLSSGRTNMFFWKDRRVE